MQPASIAHLLHTPLDQHIQGGSPISLMGSGAEEGGSGNAMVRNQRRVLSVIRSRNKAERECRLKSLQLRVKDLGLGYDSEEIILFKYCSGSCSKARTNHDLTLSLLLQKSDIPALIEEKIFSDPCCRPTHYEDVAFLDDNNQWHNVEKLSASACSCES
uniref:Artemin n=1 Tax=Geotrypetes seraphini TaxID=260995 RepID=A0A6P8PX67_GEOSA|nr:artemin-like [Geotrypetes seraphini]